MQAYLTWFKKFNENSQNISSRIKWLFGWPLSIVALYFIFRSLFTKGSTVLGAFQHENVTLLISGIVCLLIYFILRVVLWQIIIKEQKVKQSFQEIAYFWALAELKRYIPGNVWSIAGRVAHFSQNGLTKKTVLKAYFHEAQLVVIGSAVISLLGIVFILSSLLNLHIPNYLYGVITIILFACLFSLLFSNRWIKHKNYASMIVQGSFTQRLQLFCITVASFFFFGLGHFFIIASIAPLDINAIYVMTGFFVFSYLVGYLSFITPSGLGVREAILTYGLTKVMTVSQAALSSIFSRVILIAAEIIFFTIITVWYRSKFIFVQKVQKYVCRHPHVALLLLFTCFYILYFSITTFLRYDNYYTGRFDLGNMAQTVWNTQHGRIFELTDPNGTYNVSRLATHADFFLILLVPFYYIWADPQMLLLIQTVTLGVGAIFVYILAKKIIKQPTIALVLSVMYLLNPSIERTNLYDFHAVTLATTLLLVAFYFIIQKRLWWFLFFGILAGLTKEEVWFIVGLLGLYAGLINRRYIFGITTVVIMTIISYYLIAIAIPHALGAQHFALSYYSDFGATPTSVLKNILLSPTKTIPLLFSQDRIHYLIELFSPLGFLSFLAPFFLVFSFPELGIDLLSSNNNFHQIYYQYTATITPFLFIAAMYGLRRLSRWMPKWNTTVVSICLLLVTFYTVYLFGPLPGSLEPNTDMFTKQLSDSSRINSFLSHIPKRFSVAATNNIGSHLSQRQNIYTVPVGVDKADVVAFLLTDSGAQPSPEYQQALVKKLENDKNYVIKYTNGPFIVFVKISDRTAKWIEF